jgi:ketosteroid isomerase-like protein
MFMSIEKIADRLIELCRQLQFEEAQTELYADNATSIEPEGLPPGALGNVAGLAAIREKGRQFRERTEAIHSITVSEPVLTPNWFSVMMSMDITMKQFGRITMSEICVYHVRDGKIDREQFFYDVG